MVKRLGAVLACLGLAVAAAFVKGIYGIAIDALGWTGVLVAFGVFGLFIVLVLVFKSLPDPPDSPPPT